MFLLGVPRGPSLQERLDITGSGRPQLYKKSHYKKDFAYLLYSVGHQFRTLYIKIRVDNQILVLWCGFNY